MSRKALSSRHFEAIGTKTCQVLLEGSYNGILVPEVHYVGVKKDLTAIVERAYDLAMSAQTCAHRVAGLVRAVL